MVKTLGAYGYLLWGNIFDIPYKESIRSLLPVVDEFVIVTDPRFDDRTIDCLKAMAEESDKIKLVIAEIDLNNPAVDGATKTLARKHCKSNILVQVDFDEVFREIDHPKILHLKDNWEQMNPIVGTGVINWFGGNHFKMSSAGWSKERFSLNRPDVVHGIPLNYRERSVRLGGSPYYHSKPGTDGAGYISDHDGRPLEASKFLCDAKDFPNDCFNPDHIWIHHYSWYSIIRKWRMKTLWHYFWGLLYGEYHNLEEYTVDRDGGDVDFWNPARYWKQPQDYMSGIEDEMKEKTIRRNGKIEHPAIMQPWLDRQPIYVPRRGFRKEIMLNMT